MNDVLVICKGTTGQSKAFQKFMGEYIVKESLPINWVYANENQYLNEISTKDIKMVLISPEVLFVEPKIKAELDSKEIKHISIKPTAFGLRQTEKFMPEVKSILGI